MGDRLMYHFSLSLCRDPLNWLTHWTDGVESYKSEEICGWLQSVISPHITRDKLFEKKRPVRWFLSFIFLRLISLYQILLDCHYHYLLLWYSRAGCSCSESEKQTQPVFSAQGHVLHLIVLLYQSHIYSTKTSMQMQWGPCIPMICAYCFQLSGLFVLVQYSGRVLISSVLNGCQGV